MPTLVMLLVLLSGQIVWAGWLTVGQACQALVPEQRYNPGRMAPARLWVETPATIMDLDVIVDITHTEVGDLAIFLTSPAGTTAVLKQTWLPLWRQRRQDMAWTVFDDEAALSIVEGTAPYDGRYQPEGALSVFDGESAAGWWTLEIADPLYGDYGQLHYWQLDILHAPEPGGCVLALAAWGGWWCRRRRTA